MATQSNKELFWVGIVKVFEEQQVDVFLRACDSDEKTAISAHKLILAGRSEVFKKMFQTITLSELKQEELQAFVEFIYSDGSMLSEKAKKHVRSLYRAADKYEIPLLRDLCRNELISSLNSSNALKVLELAEIPFDKALSDAALTVIKTNKSTITSSTEFSFFVVDHPDLTVKIVKAISATPHYCPYCCRNL